jgi:hypothetical protein
MEAIQMQRIVQLLAVGIVAALPALPGAHAKPPAPPVPSEIEVPAGHKRFLVGHAVGVQIYSCTGSGWSFVAPRANLYDRRGRFLTSHFAGPTWQAGDGSHVVAARVDGVTVDPTAIPWLLLSATATSAGPYGDELEDTAYIQRINTTGGLAPAAAECDASSAGKQAEVPYTADYHFWKAKNG